MSDATTAVPVPAEERLHAIDTLRGIALLGVLAMNVHEWFRAPMLMYRLQPHPWGGWWNVLADTLLETFVSGKALTTFAMLFAVGLCIQSERVLARGGSFKPYAFRRLGALFAIGVLHIVLVWNGDILHNYALVGLLALPFLHRKPRTVYLWLFILAGLALAVLLGMSVFMALKPTPPWTSANPGRTARLQGLIQEMLQVRGQGTWLQESVFRLKEWNRMFGWQGDLGTTLDLFVKFLVGLAVWKSGVLRDPGAHLGSLKRFLVWAAPVALVLAAAGVLPRLYPTPPEGLWTTLRWFLPLVGASQVFGPILLALVYGASVLLLLQHASVQRLLAGFTAAGRMALTNYLLQSVAMTFLFFGWGLGLYGKLGPFLGFCITCAFFGAQVAFSRWWLARHAFGPMEWVWRTLTYGRRPGRGSTASAAVPEPTTAS